ncbi:inaD-like protein isoform X3 [Syngnathus acus]|uniref:inaD-like protein isoform X3 n=1 Tax=Syngnathus acus TaxID=161584 RepID=UPI0018862BBA|nr:inaD-like protein isoform X3 [Syngnathus acus]
MPDEAGPSQVRPTFQPMSPGERRRASAALERLRAKLAQKDEWRRHLGRVAALQDTLDSPLFVHVLALQRAVAHLKEQLSTPPEESGRSVSLSPAPHALEAPLALGAPPSPDSLHRWIVAAAAGRPSERVSLTRPAAGGLGFSVTGLHPGSGRPDAFVKHIQPGSVADRDGRLRDQILVINGRPLEVGVSQHQALALLQLPGRTVDLTVARDHPPTDMLPLASLSPPATANDVNAAERAEVEEIQLLNDGSGLGFGIVGGKTGGVVVRTLVEGGAADRDGRLRTGDRILRVGATPTNGLGSDEVVQVLQGCGSHVSLRVARDRGARRTKAPPPPDSAPVSVAPMRLLQCRSSGMPNLDGYEIHEVALTKKDGQSLGISIIGHNPLSSQDAVGVFIKHVVPGSAAHHSGNIRVQDRLIALDGVSLHGLTNREVVEVMKRTGRTVLLTLVRKNNTAAFQRSPNAVESSCGSLPRSLEFKTHTTHLDTHSTSSAAELTLKTKWQRNLGPNYQVLVIKLHPVIEDDVQLQSSSKLHPVHTLRLGVELDSFEGHHYVSCVLPGGPMDKVGVLRPEDELLQVNDTQLCGKSRREVVSFLKEVPPPFTLVCCRRPPLSECEGEKESEGHGCGLKNCHILADDHAMCRKVSAVLSELRKEQEPGEVTDQEKERVELALWSSEVEVLELHKEAAGGLGFSILDYQDPLDPGGCVMVIRSLAEGGVAQRAGALLPGDQLVSVNGVRLEGLSLEQAVRVLKGAPPGAVRLGVCKPLAVSAHNFGQARVEERVDLGGTAGHPPTLTSDPEEEGREMAVDEDEAVTETASSSSAAAQQTQTEDGQLLGQHDDTEAEADSEVNSMDAESRGMIDMEKRRRRSYRGFSITRRVRRGLPEREEGEGEETPRLSHWDPPRRVEVCAKEGELLGLSIVGGHHVIKQLRNGEELKGIFIKQVLRGSPAHATRALKTGDKILQVSGLDLRSATHQEAVDAIKSATSPVVFIVQSLSAKPRIARDAPPPLREPPPYRPPGLLEQEPLPAPRGQPTFKCMN